MTAPKKAPVPKAPVGLGKEGKVEWTAIANHYKLRADELTVLEDVCRTADMIAALDAAWAEDGRPMTTKGSMGQLVIHPLIPEINRHRVTRATFFRQLKLPDPEEGQGTKMNQHRDAANTKWSKRGA